MPNVNVKLKKKRKQKQNEYAEINLSKVVLQRIRTLFRTAKLNYWIIQNNFRPSCFDDSLINHEYSCSPGGVNVSRGFDCNIF